MTYLFFDLEYANCFSGFGKICSFGYVLCNDDFSILESQDILINPQSPFDWYLFSKKSKCQLAYSKESYQSQPPFPQFHARIASLVDDQDRLVFGFGCRNDALSLESESIRYGLPDIPFSCFDLKVILEQHYGLQGGLAFFAETLGINTEGRDFHDSRNDALFTMDVARKLCLDSGKKLWELTKAFTPFQGEKLADEVREKVYWKHLEIQNPDIKKLKTKIPVPKDFDVQAELQRIAQRNA